MFLCWVFFMLSVPYKPSMLSVIKQNVVMPSVIMLSVIMLSVIMLSVVMLNVFASNTGVDFAVL